MISSYKKRDKRQIVVYLILFQMLLFNLSSVSFVSFGESTGSTQSISNSTDILPYPLSRGSAVWVDGQNAIYIFGGRNETDMLDTIMKYTPANKKLTILDTKLPTVLMGSTAVYDGNYVYIFGGKDYDDFYDTIQRFDPNTEELQNMSARLPNPTVGAAGVWTGRYIYFFGGCWGGIVPYKFDSILRYDPLLDNITIMNSRLTYGRSGLAATWDGNYVYVVGGSDGKQYSNEVFRYSIENDTLETLEGTLPTGRLHIQAEYHQGSIFIFGGCGSPTTFYDQILRYDLATDDVEVLEETLSNPSELRMDAYDGENIYIIGGFSGPKDLNQFTIFTPGETNNKIISICPQDNTYEPIIIIFLILFFIIAITLYNKYWKKE